MVAPFLIPAAGAYVYDSLANGEEAQRQSSTQGCIDAYQIYQKITSGRGTASLHEGQAASLELSNLHSQRATQISQINSTMASAWTGEGAESARMGAQPLQTWMGDASANLGTSGQVMSTQAGAFENARNNVQPLPAEPPENSWGNKLKPWETDLDRDIAEYNDNANKNVQVFNQYHDTSSQNAGQMPQYSTMSGAYGDVSLGESGVNGGRTGPVSINEPGGGGGQGTGGAGYQSPGVSSGGVQTPAASYPGGSTPGGGAGGGSYPGGPGGSYPGVPGGGGSSTYPTTPSPNDGTSSSNYNPNFPGGPGGGVSTGPGGPYGPGGGPGFGPGGNSSTSFGPGGTPVGGGAIGTGFGPGGSAGAGGAGSGSGVGGMGGARGGAMGGAMGGGAAAGGMGAGGATGAGAGGAGAAGAAGGGAGAAGSGAAGGMRGGAGMMPMGGAAGRGQQGSDDEEHERKFMIPEDGNELFGTDQKTAPPVIGE